MEADLLSRRLLVSALGGVGNVIVVMGNAFFLLSIRPSEGEPSTTVAVSAALLFLLGAGVTFVLLRFGLVSPVAFVLLIDGLSLADSLRNSLETATQLLLDPALLRGLIVIVALLAVAEAVIRRYSPLSATDSPA